MTTLLDCQETRAALFPWSVEFYHEAARLGWIEENVELLDGHVLKKMSKSPLHQTLARELYRLLEAATPAGVFVDRECPITCAHSEPEPDVAVIAGQPTDFSKEHPLTAELVIEIAINTLQRDRRKAAIYAEANIKEYWLVEPEARQITIHRRPAGRAYAEAITLTGEMTAESQVLPAFRVFLPDLLGVARSFP